jgi:hypothetical protein
LPEQVLACLLWSSLAWKMAAHDSWIGWSDAERTRNLQYIVNHSRFLILLWVRVKGLASKILGHSARQLPGGWEQLYGYRPLLLETQVDAERFRGTCYRVANWIKLGRTQGRGRMDRHHEAHGRDPKLLHVCPALPSCPAAYAQRRAACLQGARRAMGVNLCPQCLEKQRRIDRLEEENRRLKDKLRHIERKAEEGPLGSSTPSAEIPAKANSPEEQRAKPGRAKPGHAGHGRKVVEQANAERMETVETGPTCPHCGGPLEYKEYRGRSRIDSQPLRAEQILYPPRQDFLGH